MEPLRSAEKYYSAYGHTLQTKEDFDGLLTPGIGPANLHYFVSEDEEPLAQEQADAAYQSPDSGEDGIPRLLIWRQSESYRLRRSGVGTYDLTPSSIVCYPRRGVVPEISIIHLLGSVMSLRLEADGTPALHASAVVVKDRTVTFLSNSGSGKSTLAASLVQAGYPLVTDDVLPVERSGDVFAGRPGYPQLRLWPDEARHFLGYCEELELVHPDLSKRRVPVGSGFGTFCNESKPLACLYRPERRDPADQGLEIEIKSVSPRDALIELVRHSFLAPVVEAMGWQPQRLDFFADMVRQIPVRRLVYPSATEHLPRIREAILADLETL